MVAKLFVRNLSWSVTEDELYSLFGDIGTVLSVKIPIRREDGKPRGFAFVEMEALADGEQAIARLNGQMLHNRDLVVAFQDETRSNGGGGASSGPVEKNAKLFVRNIDFTVSESELKSLFDQAGTVLSVKIAMDRDTNSSKGFGFIEMATADEAQNAINTLNGTYLNNKDIAIDFQDPNRSRARAGAASGGGYGGSRSGGGYGNGGGYNNDRW
jgi:nucleolin